MTLLLVTRRRARQITSDSWAMMAFIFFLVHFIFICFVFFSFHLKLESWDRDLIWEVAFVHDKSHKLHLKNKQETHLNKMSFFHYRFGFKTVELNGERTRRLDRQGILTIRIHRMEAFSFLQLLHYQLIRFHTWASTLESNSTLQAWPPFVILTWQEIRWSRQLISTSFIIVLRRHTWCIITWEICIPLKPVLHSRHYLLIFPLLSDLRWRRNLLNISMLHSLLLVSQFLHRFHQRNPTNRQHQLEWHQSMCHRQLQITIGHRHQFRKIVAAHRSLTWGSKLASMKFGWKWWDKTDMTLQRANERLHKFN